MTDFLILYLAAAITRGWAVNKAVRPDAEMILYDIKFNVELDTGEQTYRQVQERQAAYAGVTDYLLYVTLSDRRLQGLVKHSEAVKTIALFTTLSRVQAEPHGAVWIDGFGNGAEL